MPYLRQAVAVCAFGFVKNRIKAHTLAIGSFLCALLALKKSTAFEPSPREPASALGDFFICLIFEFLYLRKTPTIEWNNSALGSHCGRVI